MSAFNYKELKGHIGHNIECVSYGDTNDPNNVAIECEDCNEVLLDYDKHEEEEDMYIIVYVWGGLVQHARLTEDFEQARKEMIEEGDDHYDPDSDDLKIYNVKDPNNPVFSYGDYAEEMEEV